MPSHPTQYRDRETGELRIERVFGEGELRFFYEHWLGRALTNLLLARGSLSHLYGWINRSARSRARIQDFVDRLGIDVSQADRPLEAYASLDDFFTRTLKPGARPLDPDPDHLLSPADGRTLVFPRVGPEGFAVKQSQVTLAALLGDADAAAPYQGGGAMVVRLAPADYHRFHFPCDGVASAPRRLGHRLHSVHPIALGGGAPSFVNKREVTTLETERFGRLAIVEVGAMVVGTILQTYQPGPVARGQEKGTFRFGGSTVVLLTEPGRVEWDEDLVASSREGLETLLRMGTRVGVRAAPAQEG